MLPKALRYLQGIALEVISTLATEICNQCLSPLGGLLDWMVTRKELLVPVGSLEERPYSGISIA